jgi:hypothetical protein
MDEKMITFRLPPNELEIFNRYVVQSRRGKTELLREFIRSLEQRLEPPAPARAKPRRPPAKSVRKTRP